MVKPGLKPVEILNKILLQGVDFMAMSKRRNLFMSSQEFQKKIKGSSHKAASAILQSKNSSTSTRFIYL